MWHKHFRHILRERIEKLISIGIIGLLDFSGFKIYVECIEDRQTNKHKENECQ